MFVVSVNNFCKRGFCVKTLLYSTRFSTNVLGHIVSKEGISTDPDKINLIINTPQPKTITDVQSFVSLGSSNRRTIKDFAIHTALLTNLLKKLDKGASPMWTPECTKAFITLKEWLSTTPVLIPPN